MTIKKEKIIISLDIEATGSGRTDITTNHGIVALGFVIGTEQGKILEKHRICFSLEEKIYELTDENKYNSIWTNQLKKILKFIELQNNSNTKVTKYIDVAKQFEERSVKEFWSNHLDKLKEFQKEAVDRDIAIHKFLEIIDKYDDNYDVVILCDNPAFDISYLSYYMSFYANRNSLHYNKYNKYRGIFTIEKYFNKNLSEYNFSAEKVKNILSKITVKKDHYPENDAEYNYRCLISLLEYYKSAK